MALLAAVPAQSADAGRQAVASAGCAHADADPRSVSRTTTRRATLCLLNVERREHGLRGLRHNRRLAMAATRHARDMARNDYFSHDSRNGANFVDRIVDVGYVDESDPGWILGENLAWGSGRRATPREIVKAWMVSPAHRANILRRGYREVGVGVVLGAPVAGQRRAATYATEFGRRR